MYSPAQAATNAVLLVAIVLFLIGLVGVMVRRDLLFVLMSLEIMVSGAALAFIAAGAKWRQPDGQVLMSFILVAAAAEVGVGLSVVLRLYHRFTTTDSDTMSTLREG